MLDSLTGMLLGQNRVELLTQYQSRRKAEYLAVIWSFHTQTGLHEDDWS